METDKRKTSLPENQKRYIDRMGVVIKPYLKRMVDGSTRDHFHTGDMDIALQEQVPKWKQIYKPIRIKIIYRILQAEPYNMKCWAKNSKKILYMENGGGK
jgi:hypothetical protein